MNITIQSFLVSTVGILVIFFAIFFGMGGGVKPVAIGSVGDNYAYNSTTTDSSYAASNRKIKGAVNGSVPIGGVLGSVIVAGTSATLVEIMDATSTTDLASTTLARFPASPANGTYTFDSAFTRGLMVNFIGSYTGSYTITYR